MSKCGKDSCRWCDYEYPMLKRIRAKLNKEENEYLMELWNRMAWAETCQEHDRGKRDRERINDKALT